MTWRWWFAPIYYGCLGGGGLGALAGIAHASPSVQEASALLVGLMSAVVIGAVIGLCVTLALRRRRG